MNLKPTAILALVLFPVILCSIVYGVVMNRQKDKIQQLQVRNAFLEDYRRAFIELADKCDTLHQECWSVPHLRVGNTYTLSKSASEYTVYCKECKNEIPKNK